MKLKLIFMIENFNFKLGCSNSEKSVKMRSKQQAYTHVVKSAWNQALSRSRKGTRLRRESFTGTRVMTSPEVIFTICRRTNPYRTIS